MFWHHWFAIGCVFAGLGIGLGAFGAHGLEGKLSAQHLQIFETAVRYQIYHAFALLAVAFASTRVDNLCIKLAGIGFVLGIFLFSGSLHTLVFIPGASRWVWPLTPLGGTFFIVSWILLASAAFC